MPPNIRSNTDQNSRGVRGRYHGLFFGLFVGQWLLVLVKFWWDPFSFGYGGWAEMVLFVLAASSTLASLSRELPWQNVLMVSGIIVIITSIIQRAGKHLGVELGLVMSGGNFLVIPFVWLVAILNARGAAQVALSRWRGSPSYGLWLLGTASLLVGLFGLGLEFFGTSAGASRAQQPLQSKLPTETAAALCTVGYWSIVAGVSMLLATPSLINKSPVERAAGRQPATTWLLLNLLCASAAFLKGGWLAGSIVVLANIIILFLAFGGFPIRHRPN